MNEDVRACLLSFIRSYFWPASRSFRQYVLYVSEGKVKYYLGNCLTDIVISWSIFSKQGCTQRAIYFGLAEIGSILFFVAANYLDEAILVWSNQDLQNLS